MAELFFSDIYIPLLSEYKKSFNSDVMQKKVNHLSKKQTAITKDTFGFYTSIASVFSSKIEGEQIELDSYIKHKFLSVTYVADYTKKTDDLFKAYEFARESTLNEKSLLKTHAILSKHLLTSDKRGKIRTQQMFVMSKDKQIEYVAANANIVKQEHKKLMNDMKILLEQNMELAEIFFYASMMHLIFVKVHPMYDGNGRTARLFEKWFLAQKLGDDAWNIESERYYYENINNYYQNIRRAGNTYETLDYSKALPFTQMLLQSLDL